jgi:hypothetical protein
MDSDAERAGLVQNDNAKLKEILKMTKNGPSNERKEKLKIRLLNES